MHLVRNSIDHGIESPENKLYDLTEYGGYLFIGHSESLNREMTRYKYIMPAVYRKE
jgi:chemotaxis protein methyltransferase CheR